MTHFLVFFILMFSRSFVPDWMEFLPGVKEDLIFLLFTFLDTYIYPRASLFFTGF